MKNQIRLITYNILADYLNSHEFVLVNKKYLDNQYREKLLSKIFKKILENDNKNTFFCLQEVGPTQLSYLTQIFLKNKYSHISYKDVAIFYPDNFDVKSIEINFINKLAPKYLNNKPRLIEKINNFNHIYILLELQSKNVIKFTLCTTHLVANPKYKNIKTLQSYLIAKRLEDFKRVIFCGDFNSKPDSEVYELLNTGEVKYPYYGKLKIKNNFISSYYKLYENEDNITTHTANKVTPIFTETIDYIWITPNIIPIKTSKVITRKDTNNLDLMPNKIEPSDHFFLINDLQIK